jgi:DnaJ-class molecular chaperone
MKSSCLKCNGKGNGMKICEVSGANLVAKCAECEGTGKKVQIYYANVLCHKNIGNMPFMGVTLYNTISEAQEYKHREFFILKTIEIKI